ncbi:hypothetical protein ACSNOK_19810 [Streptomyces sp. URMC 126]|uniref:hypothetical protein n=1 Tax=Streptomyces sp. URMC 126 TaxID=3423401 RepID=UPI003F1CC722
MPEDIFGDLLPQQERPRRKRQMTDTEQRSREQRIADCLNHPATYELAEHLTPPPAVGCPRRYPALVYLLLATLLPVTGSKRSAVGALTPAQWSSLRAAIRHNAGRRTAALLPPHPPTRAQYLYAEQHILAPAIDTLQHAFEDHAHRQALAHGLFPTGAPRNWACPERFQLLAGDATVAKAPSKAEQPRIVDAATGEVRHHRVDPAARLYYENGEQAATVARGTKWFFASARHTGYGQRVILSFRHVAGGAYEDEAAVAVRSFTALAGRLPGCMGVLYDGAFRGTHRDALARHGLLVINKQHGSAHPRAYELLRFPRCRHELWCDQGRIAERLLLDDGTTHLMPVPVLRLEHRRGKAKSRWYHVLGIPCRNGPHAHRVAVGITTTRADRTSIDPSTGRRLPSDTERGFHRAEYLQQIPQNTLAHQLLYPFRSDAESLHQQLDSSLWNRRMVSYGLARQKVFILGFALAHNATSHGLRREQPPCVPPGGHRRL